MSEENNFFSKLPKRTPLWAVGFVAIVTSMSASFVFIQNSLAPGKVLASVLNLVQSNAAEVSTLSENLVKVQGSATLLAIRVSSLETEVASTRNDLSDCQLALSRRRVCAKK